MGQGGATGVTAENPEEIYRGRAGYQRMLGEIRESLYAQIPEARGSVEIFDHLADPDREIERIARTFDLSVERLQQEMGYDKYEDFKKDLNGHSLSATLPDGRFIAIAAAWDPDNRHKDPEKMTFDDIHTYARIITHETLHGLDPRIRNNQKLGADGWIIGNYANSRSAEMFADVGAQDLMLRNGDLRTHTYRLMTQYDATAAFAGPYSKEFFEADNTRYDNGPFMQQLLDRHRGGEGLQNFRFEGWRETIDEVSAMRESGNPELSIDSTLRNYAQTPALQQIYREKVEALETKLAPVRDVVLKESGFENLREFIDYYMDDMNFQGWQDGTVDHSRFSPQMRTALQGIFDTKVELGDWLEQNRDRFQDAARIASATRYLTGQQQSHVSRPAPSTAELTNDMLMARNWAQFRETGNELYKRAAREYGEMAEHTEIQAHERSGAPGDAEPYDRYLIIEQLFGSRPDLVEAVARGVPLNDLVSLDRVNPDNLNDDIYSVSKDFDAVIARHAARQDQPAQDAPAAQPPSLQPPLKP